MRLRSILVPAKVTVLACGLALSGLPAEAQTVVRERARVAEVQPTPEQKAAEFEQWLKKATPKIQRRTELVNRILANVTSDAKKLGDAPKLLGQLAAMLHSAQEWTLLELTSARSVDEVQSALVAAQREARLFPSLVEQRKAALGDDINLVFTAITPCRIADSRSGTIGKRVSGITYNYRNFGAASQGGDPNCNAGSSPDPKIAPGADGALALTVTVTETTGLGWLMLKDAQNSTSFTASALNWTAANETVANTTVVSTKGAVGTFCGFGSLPPCKDFQLQIGGGNQAHVIIDLVGFYLPAEAAALDCVDGPTASATTGTNPAVETQATSTCPVGYTVTGGSCNEGDDAVLVDSFKAGNGWTCGYIPRASTATSFTVIARCCRTPGTSAGRL